MKKIIKMFGICFCILIVIFCIFRIFDIERKILIYLYPKKYEKQVEQYAKEANIDTLLVYAIIKTESNFQEKVESKSGAIGLMQLMEKTAKEQAKKLNIEYTKEKLYQAEYNLKLGLNYFNTLLDYYNQNYILAFAAYNAGLGNVNSWIEKGIIKEDGSDIENIPFKETNMYVRKIIRNYDIYKEIY